MVVEISGWLVSGIIRGIIKVVADYIKHLPNLKDKIKRLETSIPQVLTVVEAAEKIQSRDGCPTIRDWLWHLKDALEQAEDVLDELEYIRLEKEVNSSKNNKVRKTLTCFKKVTNHAFKHYSFLERIKEAVEDLDRIIATLGNFIQLVYTLQQQQQPQIMNNRITSSIPTIQIEEFTRKEELEYLIEILTSSDNVSGDPTFLPIVGSGGIGKTTLAQQVYNDERTTKHFYLRIWVCVSNDFDVLRIIHKMAESAWREKADFLSLDALQLKLKEELTSKRFLLVLDDVWNDDDRNSWEKIVALLRFGRKGSKVLITTRLRSVIKMIPGIIEPIVLKGLQGEKYQLLFEKYAFLDEDASKYPKLREVGKEIIKKLGGSPLAAKTVGGILYSKLDEVHWTNILNSDILDINHGNDSIVPVLKLSYYHLPIHLRQCFTFCSIFPQDYEFEKNQLIHWWIAAGFVKQHENQIERVEDVGVLYFEELLRRSFFEFHSKPYKRTFVMHDLLHDLASYVAKGECIGFRISDKHSKLQKTLRHLAIEINDLALLQEVSKLKHLRTLFLTCKITCPKFESALRVIFRRSTNLRVLSLATEELKTVSDSICSLKHLRYFSLSQSNFGRSVILPKVMDELYHLQVLDVRGYLACNFSGNLKNLINLRHLVGFSYPIPLTSGVGRLNSLEELDYLYIQNNKGHKLAELERMTQLKTLCMQNVGFVLSGEESRRSKLFDKSRLMTLEVAWNYKSKCRNSKLLDEDILDGLMPHDRLQNLVIRGYGGARFPHWMENCYLKNLVVLRLDACRSCKELPPLGELPNLQVLLLNNFYVLEKLDSRFYGRNELSAIFPSLLTLSLSGMTELREWTAFETGYGNSHCLTRLTIEIENCPKLRKLPTLPLNLIELQIFCCPNLRELPSLPPDLKRINVFNVGLITLPPVELWCRLRMLEKLDILNCAELRSLGGLEALPVRHLSISINNCPKLVDAAFPTRIVMENQCVDTPLMHVEELHIDDLALLELPILAGLMSVRKLDIFFRHHQWKWLPERFEQWLLLRASSIQELRFCNLSSLESLPESLLSLKSLECLWLVDAPQLQSLPSLPTSVKLHAGGEIHPRLMEEIERRNQVFDGLMKSI